MAFSEARCWNCGDVVAEKIGLVIVACQRVVPESVVAKVDADSSKHRRGQRTFGMERIVEVSFVNEVMLNQWIGSE